ncbi:uncharacterized protein LOC6615401 isoform X2 [Drosophila sechellia]|uniref:GM15708 n=1 Tax=Drosophila sechellia TaxID=7238 RepID=B4I7S3_DROSE|nr:uncharacterized protein LOC6615401 isoform X2 [Drosophila sechellia]EDW56648.1 GM15708 [Drosophila sechellia]
MSPRRSLLCCLLVSSILLLHQAQANIETNDVNDPNYYMLQGVRVYPNDRQCVMVGGLCVAESDCIEPTSNKGLCPTSAGEGVECCYELRSNPTPASHR